MDSNINRISLELPDSNRQAIAAAIQVLQEQLLPHLIALSPEDRGSLHKMGDRTVSFVRKAAAHLPTHCARADAHRPSFLDMEEMDRDLSAVQTLTGFARTLGQIASNLDDSIMAAGAEAYAAALVYYQSTKAAARSRVPGAQAILDELSQSLPVHSGPRKPVPAAQG